MEIKVNDVFKSKEGDFYTVVGIDGRIIYFMLLDPKTKKPGFLGFTGTLETFKKYCKDGTLTKQQKKRS